MKQSVKRVILEGGGQTKVEFDNPSSQYLVKNFSDEDIFVSFEEGTEDDESIKITKDYAQLCVINAYSGQSAFTKEIFIKGTGEVEVQQLWIS